MNVLIPEKAEPPCYPKVRATWTHKAKYLQAKEITKKSRRHAKQWNICLWTSCSLSITCLIPSSAFACGHILKFARVIYGMLCGSTCPAIKTRKCNVLCFSAFQVERYLASDVSLWDESPCNSKNRQESDYFSIFYCFGALDLFVFVP